MVCLKKGSCRLKNAYNYFFYCHNAKSCYKIRYAKNFNGIKRLAKNIIRKELEMKKKILIFCSIVIALFVLTFSVGIKAEESSEVVTDVPSETPSEVPPSDTLETETDFNELLNGIIGTVLSGLSGVIGASGIFGAVLIWLRKRASNLELKTDLLNVDSKLLKENTIAFIDEVTKLNNQLQEKVAYLEKLVLDNQNAIMEEFKQFMEENNEHFSTFKTALKRNSDLIVATSVKDPQKVANGVATNVYEVNKKYEEN